MAHGCSVELRALGQAPSQCVVLLGLGDGGVLGGRPEKANSWLFPSPWLSSGIFWGSEIDLKMEKGLQGQRQ